MGRKKIIFVKNSAKYLDLEIYHIFPSYFFIFVFFSSSQCFKMDGMLKIMFQLRHIFLLENLTFATAFLEQRRNT
jgi:hypothetical protein